MNEVTSSNTYRAPWKKRVLKHSFIRLIIGFGISLLLRFIYATCRKTRDIHPESLPYMQGQSPALFCFWHGRMIFMSFFKPKHRAAVALISSHGDGSFITSILRFLGVASVRGSSSRGGEKALGDLYTLATMGQKNIAITPDGPRGPNQKASLGVIWLAAQTGLPILPVSFSCSRRKHAKSWDKFLLPLPFSHAHFIVSAPIIVGSTDPDILKSARSTLELTLTRLTQDADHIVDGVQS